MIQCQNCGEVNNYGSNFCRFCGTRMIIPQNARGAEYTPNPPRPYMWKTDEFQVKNTSAKTTSEIRRAEPLQQQQTHQMQRQTAQHLSPNYYQSPPMQQQLHYRCPRCGTHYYPQLVKKISSAGWVIFSVLLVFFFPLFWIGLLIKENVKICPVCNVRVG